MERSVFSWLVSPRPMAAAGCPSREIRVDFVRGLALLFIFVNHIPGNPLSIVTPAHLFFSDAADAFVLLSGFAVAVAFGPRFDRQGAVVGTARVGARISELYGAHLLTLISVAAVTAWAAARFERPEYFDAINILLLFTATEDTLIRAVTLTFQPSYLDILPLYIVLLALSPLLLLLARTAPILAFGASAALWLVVQAADVNLPNGSDGAGWFFNPFAWQLLFTIGLLAGLAMLDGVTLPRSAVAVRAAATVALGCFGLKVLSGQVSFLEWAALLPPDLAPRPSKTSLSLWRVANVLALAYLIAVLVPAGARWLSSAPAKALTMLGRRSLAVFAFGTALSISGSIALTEAHWSTLAVIVVNGSGVVAMLAAARLLDWYDDVSQRARQPALMPQAEPRPRSIGLPTPVPAHGSGWAGLSGRAADHQG